MSNFTLYFAYRDRLFKFHEPCLMDVSYQLSPVYFPSESSPLPSPGIELTLFGYVTGANQCLLPLCHVSSSTHGTVEEGRSVQRAKRWNKHGDKDEDNSPKNLKNVHNTSYQKYTEKKKYIYINSNTLGMSLDLKNAFIHYTMCPQGHLAQWKNIYIYIYITVTIYNRDIPTVCEFNIRWRQWRTFRGEIKRR